MEVDEQEQGKAGKLNVMAVIFGGEALELERLEGWV